MSQNLITGGIIDPRKFSREKVLQEAATILDIDPGRIDELQFWPYQLWVNIDGVGATFMSYRCLAVWKKEIIAAIRRCQNLKSLIELSNILNNDFQDFAKHYQPEVCEELREALKNKCYQKKEEEENLRPFLEHQQAAQKWLETWEHFLSYCQNEHLLQQLEREIREQSSQFSNFPLIIKEIKQLWQLRREEIIEREEV